MAGILSLDEAYTAISWKTVFLLDYLTNALQENGFEILDTQRKEYEHNGEQVKDLLLIAKKY